MNNLPHSGGQKKGRLSPFPLVAQFGVTNKYVTHGRDCLSDLQGVQVRGTGKVFTIKDLPWPQPSLSILEKAVFKGESGT